MKAQACQFKRKVKSQRESGIAIIKEFGVSDVLVIIDENGLPVKAPVWNYWLTYGPASMIDTDLIQFRLCKPDSNRF